MNKQLLALAAVSLLTLAAPSDLRSQDTAYWTQADLAAYAKSLAPKINEQHFALERLGEFGSHFALMVHREGNGPAEIHDEFTDFYVVAGGSRDALHGRRGRRAQNDRPRRDSRQVDQGAAKPGP